MTATPTRVERRVRPRDYYWLPRCEGYTVVTKDGRLGTVFGVEFDAETGAIDALRVRCGLLRTPSARSRSRTCSLSTRGAASSRRESATPRPISARAGLSAGRRRADGVRNRPLAPSAVVPMRRGGTNGRSA